MLKKWAALLLCFIVAVGFSACGNNQANAPEKNQTNEAEQTNKPEEGKIQVTVTFNAMKEFVAAVGKDKVEISTIIPDGMEPHDFEPKAKDLVGLSKANVFVYNGLGMEVWAEDAITAASNKNLITVEASKGSEAIENQDTEEIEEHGQYDPHLWISL